MVLNYRIMKLKKRKIKYSAFSLIGILAKISTCLAENDIGIFAISTFNTDYILTKAENFEKAVKTLEAKGYKIC